MAELDYTINQLITKKSYFTDLINGGVFGGRQILSEDNLELIRKYLPDYHINLIQANQIENLEQFKTDLQYIFGVLKYNTKRTMLYEYVKENREALKRMDQDALMAMWSLMGGAEAAAAADECGERRGEERYE